MHLETALLSCKSEGRGFEKRICKGGGTEEEGEIKGRGRREWRKLGLELTCKTGTEKNGSQSTKRFPSRCNWLLDTPLDLDLTKTHAPISRLTYPTRNGYTEKLPKYLIFSNSSNTPFGKASEHRSAHLTSWHSTAKHNQEPRSEGTYPSNMPVAN